MRKSQRAKLDLGGVNHYSLRIFCVGTTRYRGFMFGFLRFLSASICAGLLLTSGVFADEEVPASGAFVTLEKAKGGALKYASSKADGKFVIKSLSEGKYRMSITPPKRDRVADFAMAVQGTFTGIIVIPDGKVVKAKGGRPDRSGRKPGSTILIPASVWRKGPIWLNVEIALEDVNGRFDYVLSDEEDMSVMVLGLEEERAP